MEVIILAGGLGTRLRSEVKDVPKCMAPVAGKPFLWYLLKDLTKYEEVNRVILSVGYLREVIFEWIDHVKNEFPFEFVYAIEEQPLGTGGGIKLALSKSLTNDVVVLNGDTFFAVNLRELMEAHRLYPSAVTLALKPMQDFERYGRVIIDEVDKRIVEFKEKEYCKEGLINGGVYVINKLEPIFEGLPEKFSFETAVLEPQCKVGKLFGVVQKGYFIDIGIPEDYKRADNELFYMFDDKIFMRTHKKIVYFGHLQLADADFSYLHEAQKLVDMNYYMETNPIYMNGPALSINKLYPKSGIFKAKDVYEEFKKYEGFIDLDKCYVINTTGRFWLLKSFWFHFILLFRLLYDKINVLHIAWPLNVYQFILYFLRTRMILTVHDPFPHSYSETFIFNLRRKVGFALTSNFVILNKNQKADFIKYYHLEKKNVSESQLSNYTLFQMLANNSIKCNENEEYILAFGRICRYKGFDYLLPAMKKVHEKHPECKLVIAGKGDFHFDISEYASLDYIDLRNRFIPDEEMVTLVKNALFMVCPYTDATQSGVIMSSYAFYRPVVATNVGGLPEMVIDGKYGFIVQEKNVDALADAIIKLLDNRVLLDTFSKNIEEDYTSGERSWRETAKKLVEEYAKLN